MKHVMVDLETVGCTPGSGIIAIGAVMFEREQDESLWRIFEVPIISRQSNVAIGLTSDQSTIDWWSKQEPAARQVYDAALLGGDHIVEALLLFDRAFPVDACLWGNGADFDNALLACAYKAAALIPPWAYVNNRCFRTMRKEHAVVEPLKLGVHHNALDDALHQTRWLQKIWREA